MLSAVVFASIFVITPIFSARILGIVPTPSYSHQIVFQPLWRELLSRGHQLTLLTTDPLKDSSLVNLTEIDFSFSYETWNKALNMNEWAKWNVIRIINQAIEFGSDLVEEQLQHPEVQDLLNNNTLTYDLVIIEVLFPAMTAFSEKFNCPTIQVISMEALSVIYNAIGNPSHPVLNPDALMVFSEKPTFFERLISTFNHAFVKYYFYPQLIKSYNRLIKKYFGNDYPDLQDMLSKTSMLFVNTDTTFHTVRPLLPNVIQIGGATHLTSPKLLPQNLQNILDHAENGVIYFSLGSNVKSNLLSESIQKILLESFAELPYTVLWKFEQEDLPGQPANVMISKWFPQQDIFRHPNVKLFITQGGLQSTEEAIYNHIPMIGMPFIGDQLVNMKRMERKGMGLSMDIHSLEKETFKNAILEIINNPKYRNKVKELAELAQDQPMTGIERAVWWTEYVLRHKGAAHLRSPALDLPDYQYFLLDVIGFCIFILLLVVYALFKLFKYSYRLIKCFIPKSKLKAQ